jgi:hypothetical protein
MVRGFKPYPKYACHIGGHAGLAGFFMPFRRSFETHFGCAYPSFDEPMHPGDARGSFHAPAIGATVQVARPARMNICLVL